MKSTDHAATAAKRLLVLNRETIRALDAQDLEKAVGGQAVPRPTYNADVLCNITYQPRCF